MAKLYILLFFIFIMGCLVACLSTGKGTWVHVSKLLNYDEFDKIFLITNDFGNQNFNSSNSKVELIVINDNDDLEKIRDDIKFKLKGRLIGTEIAINLFSGSGKDHMALLSAVLQLGYGIRLYFSSDSGVKEL